MNSEQTGNPVAAAGDDTLAFRRLGPAEILDSIEALGFVTDGRLLALNSYENRVYQVGIEEESPIVAKYYRPGRWSDAAILEEHAFARELAAADVPVVPPMEIGGRTLHHVEPFRVAVFPRHGGHAAELDDPKLLRQIGRLTARLHNCGERIPFEHRPTIDIAGFGASSRRFLLEEAFIPAELETSYETLTGDLLARAEHCFAAAGDARRIRLHGDLHPSNLLVRDDRVHIVDLDDARMGPAVQDLWMFLSGDRPEQTPQLAELLTGYTEFRPFEARELRLIEALRTLRIMHYAAWLARRWEDPAFRQAFPWFNTQRYWGEHILALREQAALMDEEPLVWTQPW
ncbi:MAG: serine/threonine protein kinase [Gammaproteobacteria bacterium]